MLDEIKEKIKSIYFEKLDLLKAHVAVELNEARVKIVRARVRGGKIQRRKKVSNVKGYTIRGGRLVKMKASERMHRKRAARKAKIKRKAKMARALIKRKRSLRKRASLGL
jgi:hypothetical protein